MPLTKGSIMSSLSRNQHSHLSQGLTLRSSTHEGRFFWLGGRREYRREASIAIWGFREGHSRRRHRNSGSQLKLCVMQDRTWPNQGPASGSMWGEPRVVEDRGRERQAVRHAGCKPKEFRLYLMCNNTVRLCFQALTVWNGWGDARGQWSQGSCGGHPGD